ncbi:MAG: hypothetical protein EOO20_09895 [Chryseobacterium sp.]|nr:MAG: hypothetical protein EOO20_09895 [Chryseobacterium sp.]
MLVFSYAGSAGSRATSITCRNLASLPNSVRPDPKLNRKQLEAEHQLHRATLEPMLQLHLAHSSPDDSQSLGGFTTL